MQRGARLNSFPLGSIQTPFRALILGPSQSGKTSVALELLYTHRDVPNVIIFNRTESANPKYKGVAPDILIFDHYSGQAMEGFMNVQEEKCLHRSKGKKIDTRAIAVYDDLQSTAKEWGRSELTSRLATAGRNIDISWICLFQSPIVKGIEADIREQFTHLFIFPFEGQKEKFKLREYYCDLLSKAELEKLFNEDLGKYECLVYDRTKGPKAPLTEKLFHMSANSAIPPFRIGHSDYWKLNAYVYDPLYKEKEIEARKQKARQLNARTGIGLRKD